MTAPICNELTSWVLHSRRDTTAIHLSGTSGTPSDDGIILPYPFDGKFFHYTDPTAPILHRHVGSDIILTLPPEVEVSDLKWISVWCRRFSVNFGDLLIDNVSTESPLEEEGMSLPNLTRSSFNLSTRTSRCHGSSSIRGPRGRLHDIGDDATPEAAPVPSDVSASSARVPTRADS